MRVAVTGSSGLLGQALLPALEAAGHETIALVRRPPIRGEARWDPATGSIDRSALEGIDGAINLAGKNVGTRWSDRARREIRESRISSTTLLAHTLAALSPQPKVLVSMSAVGYYGDRGDELLTEESGPGNGFLPDLVSAWEASADAARTADIRVVHPRAGVVLSREGGALKKMLPAFQLGAGGRVGSGRQWMSWIALDDMIAGLVFLLTCDSLAGPVNLSASPVRNSEFTRQLGGALRRPAIIPAPVPALQLVYGKQMIEENLLASTRVSSSRLLESGFRLRFPEIGAAFDHVLNVE
jgi:uncharacterized protein (TIGR01777 family)